MSLNLIAWATVILVAVVAYALITAEDNEGGDE